MNPMSEHAPMLKQLRLSGILDSLEVRNKQAIDKKMAYAKSDPCQTQPNQCAAFFAIFYTFLKMFFDIFAVSSVHIQIAIKKFR